MRTLPSALAVAAVIGISAQPADAYRARKGCYEDRHGHLRCRTAAVPRRDSYSYDRARAEAEYDRARAEDVDPGGSYKAYPDWARYALSPKGNR